MKCGNVNSAANARVEQAIAEAVRAGREIGVQVAAYLDGKLVIDAWGGLADHTTDRKVDGDTLDTNRALGGQVRDVETLLLSPSQVELYWTASWPRMPGSQGSSRARKSDSAR